MDPELYNIAAEEDNGTALFIYGQSDKTTGYGMRY